jgi:GNAT superfamily N-acetyltransferase
MTALERRPKLSKPAALTSKHIVAEFDCGRPELTDWLKDWSRRASDVGTAMTFVVCRGTRRVVGYFCLSAGAVDHVINEETGEKIPRGLRQNAIDPVPVIILGRLGVDKTEQGKGLGSALVAEAMKRAAKASRLVGARALLVHALDERLVAYYQSLGFLRFAPPSQTLYIPIKTIRDGL